MECLIVESNQRQLKRTLSVHVHRQGGTSVHLMAQQAARNFLSEGNCTRKTDKKLVQNLVVNLELVSKESVFKRSVCMC